MSLIKSNCTSQWLTFKSCPIKAIIQLGQTFFILDTGLPVKTGTLANSEDPDEMPHKAAFHEGLHCLLKKNGGGGGGQIYTIL